MKKAILAALIAIIPLTAVAAELTMKQKQVWQSIDETSAEYGQWLPMWNQIATAQLQILMDSPGTTFTASLITATKSVQAEYTTLYHWDDFWFCEMQIPSVVSERGKDVQYDYCASVYGTDSKWTKDMDPDKSTNMGGMFWTNHGRT